MRQSREKQLWMRTTCHNRWVKSDYSYSSFENKLLINKYSLYEWEIGVNRLIHEDMELRTKNYKIKAALGKR